jgi:hypothetical protein
VLGVRGVSHPGVLDGVRLERPPPARRNIDQAATLRYPERTTDAIERKDRN